VFDLRNNTNSIKWDLVHHPGETLPLWVAEMDFPIASEIQAAVTKRGEHPFFGYSLIPEETQEAVVKWFSQYHQISLNKGDILSVSGVVPALYAGVEAFSRPGEGVIYQPPVYNPIIAAAKSRDRRGVPNPLVWREGRWEIDWEDLEQKARDPQNTLMILCSPHNPVGRVWSRDEVERIIGICREFKVTIISDEIHCDLVMPSYRHFSLLACGGEDVGVVLTATGKTFNLPGLNSARAFVKDPGLKKALVRILGYGYKGHGDPMNEIAAQAAYTQGRPWLEDVLARIEAHYRILREYCLEREIPIAPLEGTYLAWFNLGSLGSRTLEDLETQGGLKLNMGPWFGPQGAGWCRLNLACPEEILREALNRMDKFLQK